MNLLGPWRLWKFRRRLRRFDLARTEFDRATAGMTEEQLDAEVARIVREVRSGIRLRNSATVSETVWNNVRSSTPPR